MGRLEQWLTGAAVDAVNASALQRSDSSPAALIPADCGRVECSRPFFALERRNTAGTYMGCASAAGEPARAPACPHSAAHRQRQFGPCVGQCGELYGSRHDISTVSRTSCSGAGGGRAQGLAACQQRRSQTAGATPKTTRTYLQQSCGSHVLILLGIPYASLLLSVSFR